MKKEILLIIILGAIIIVLAGILAWTKPVKSPNQLDAEGGLQIISPAANAEIFSPIKISGTVNGGGWAGFEGQVGTVKLLDYNGKQIGQTQPLTAITDWMQPKINFEATLTFVAQTAGPATLVFANENPKGDPARDRTFVLPVVLKAGGETMAVKVYFGKSEISGSTCNTVFSVERIIPKTQAVAEAAINEMLKGPTETEKAQGYFSSIPAGSKLNSIKIENGKAYVDFNQAAESGGGSCSMAERVSQINFTLKQFSTVKDVVLSINGRTAGIFQP